MRQKETKEVGNTRRQKRHVLIGKTKIRAEREKVFGPSGLVDFSFTELSKLK